MKYAHEVISLMGAYPGRGFRMKVIVNSVMASLHLTSNHRVAVRKGVMRVMDQLIESKTVCIEPSRSGQGSFALYYFGQKCDMNDYENDPGSRTITRAELRPHKKQADPMLAYRAQKGNAKCRGIEWHFTFESWWEIWRPYFHMRGPGRDDLCMGRYGDVGPYSPQNVYLTTNSGNAVDRGTSTKAMLRRKATKERREAAYFYRAPSGEKVLMNVSEDAHDESSVE